MKDRQPRTGVYRKGGYNNTNFSDDHYKETFHAVCDECGKDCDLPFKPTNNKPVYCRDCFAKQGGGSSDRGDRRGGGDHRGGGNRGPRSSGGGDLERKLDRIEKKLDQILENL